MFGGPEITGVLLELSVLLQAANIKQQLNARKRIASCQLPVANSVVFPVFAVLTKLAVGNWQVAILFVELIVDSGGFILFLGEWFTGHSILTFDPTPQVDKLASFRTEGTIGILFPLDRRATGWTFHES